MMIFKKAIPRRTLLRGMGAAFALPLLDGMIPAFGDTASKPAARLSTVYVPNGMIMESWTPAKEGAGFELSPILQPLAPFRDRLVVVSGLSHMIAERRAGEVSGPHSRSSGGYLTGVHTDKSSDIRAGISMDQIAAAEIGKHTQLSSMELSMESAFVGGQCDGNLSCAYTNTISWRTPTTPMPMESNPRAVFERMFGDSNSTDPAERLARARNNRSVLDSVIQDSARLVTGLGPSDRAKLTQYFDAIRDVERRIQMGEEKASKELPTLERPAGVPANFEEHAKLMFDLQVLAYQIDLARVITFMMGHELSGRTFREIGISDPHHPLSHHANDPEKIAKVVQINLYHVKAFAYFLDRLKSTPDGDGSLLDHIIILYGASLGDPNTHGNSDLPALLAGGGGGRLKGGRHLRYPKEPPITNLYLTMLEMLGAPVESLGDSTGKLELLSV